MAAGSNRFRTLRRSRRLPRTPAEVSAKPSPFLRTALFGWFALVIGAILVLRSFDIGLGQGSFAYRYSPMQGERIFRSLWLVPIAALVAVAIVWSGRRRKLAPLVALLAIGTI